MSKLSLVLLFGGVGGEHEVSCVSAASIYSNLDKNLYDIFPIAVSLQGGWFLQSSYDLSKIKKDGKLIYTENDSQRVIVAPGLGLMIQGRNGSFEPLKADVVFNIVHGIQGEDGRIQGLLDCAGIPCTGAGALASALGMDKEKAKQIWEVSKLPVVPYKTLWKQDYEALKDKNALFDEIKKHLGLPCFVKPANSGSSVGVSKVNSELEFGLALEEAFKIDRKVLIEQGMTVQEVEVAVLGNQNPDAFGPGEIAPSHEFYDYEAKYLDPDGADLLIPARLEKTLADKILKTAVVAFKALDCRGFARVDFFVDKKTGAYYLNEINTLPGFTTISMFPRMVMHSGFSYQQVLNKIIDYCVEDARVK